jgi:hypothetical protein
LLKRFRMSGLPFYSAAIIFILKCISGLTLAWIYTKIYRDRSTADVFKLFDDSKYLFEAFYENPRDYWSMVLGLDHGSPYYDSYFGKMGNWNKSFDSGLALLNDNRSIIRLHALIRIISFDSYAVHVMIFNLMSLAGLVAIYKSFVTWFAGREYWLAAIIFLMPSVLCWSSGLLKEAPLIMLVGLFISIMLRWNANDFKISDILKVILLVLGFLILKIYVLLALIPAVVAMFFVKRFKHVGVRFINSAVLISGAFLVWAISALVPQLDVMQHLSFMQQSMLRAAFYYDAGSVLNVQPLEPHWWSFLRNLPEALINAAYRPGILDAKNGLQWFAAFENAGIVFFTLLTIGLYKKPETREKQQIVWFCLSFVIVLYAVMGLSTPILGNLVRYRIPTLPFYMIALLLLCDLERLKLIVFEIIRYEPGNNSNIRSNIGNR